MHDITFRGNAYFVMIIFRIIWQRFLNLVQNTHFIYDFLMSFPWNFAFYLADKSPFNVSKWQYLYIYCSHNSDFFTVYYSGLIEHYNQNSIFPDIRTLYNAQRQIENNITNNQWTFSLSFCYCQSLTMFVVLEIEYEYVRRMVLSVGVLRH